MRTSRKCEPIRAEEEAAANLVVHYWNQHQAKAGSQVVYLQWAWGVDHYQLLANQAIQANHLNFQSQEVILEDQEVLLNYLGWLEDRVK